MKEKIRKLCLVICALVFLFSGYQLVKIFMDYKKIDDQNEMIKETVVTEEKEEFSVNFDELKSINQDVQAWINIEGTDISYAIVQSGDNDYYLYRDINQKYSKAGTIFLDYSNKSDFSDFNTIIYGHNMKNGSMFGQLNKYKSEEYYKKHPYIDIYQQGVKRRYEIFAAGQIAVENTVAYKTNPKDIAIRQQIIENTKKTTPYTTGVEVNENDQIITLSTCVGNGNYDYRYVVNAKLIETIKEDVN